MNRHTFRAAFLASALAMVVVACSAPDQGPRISPATATERATAPAPSVSAEGAEADLGPAPEDLHDADWDNAVLPGDFCQIPGTIRLAEAEATATSRTWGRVHIGLLPKRLYGDVTGDGRVEAALNVGCDNGGGTAAGQLAFAVVVITSKNGMLRSLGSLGAQHDSPGVHTPLLSATKLEREQVTVTESWYRPSDSTCCPTGTDVSTWTFGADGKLSVVNSRTTS